MMRCLAVLLTACLAAWPAAAQFDVRAGYGALGDGVTDDTAAFQSAWNAAKAVKGKIIVPPANAGQCYVVGPLDGTMASGVTVEGFGDGSRLCANAGGNWWDLSGSSFIVFKALSVAPYGTAVPANLWLWATVNSWTVLHGLRFDAVNVDAKASTAFLYGYGFSGLTCRDSAWTQRYNGPAAANSSVATTVLRLDAAKSVAVASAFATIATGITNAIDVTMSGCSFVEYAQGVSGHSNDTAIACVMCGLARFTGGSVGSRGPTAWVIWNNAENLTVDGTAFVNPSGAVGDSKSFIELGGGANGSILLKAPWFSVPDVGGCFICIGVPVSGLGGVTELDVLAPNPGGNTYGVPFVGLTPGFSCPLPLNPWIVDSVIQGLNGANNIVTCGSIVSSDLVSPGFVTVPPGSDPCEARGQNGEHCNSAGLIEKWGATAAIPAGGYAAVAFPVPFPNATDNCLANAEGLWPPGTVAGISINIGGPANIALINTSATTAIPAASWTCKGH